VIFSQKKPPREAWNKLSPFDFGFIIFGWWLGIIFTISLGAIFSLDENYFAGGALWEGLIAIFIAPDIFCYFRKLLLAGKKILKPLLK